MIARSAPLSAVVALGLVLAGATVGRSSAQEPAAPAPRTTLNGVYTLAQADKGEEIYFGACVNCHPKGTYAGESFKANWAGRPLSDLYDWVKTKMPNSDPGTLTANQSVQVVAYILQQNSLPAGKTPMPADRTVLSTIKIQLK